MQLLLFGSVIATENCVYDQTYFSEANYIEKGDVKSVVWEVKYKVAKIITKKGALISVQHWACNHLGLQAVLLLNSIEMADQHIVVKKIQIMAKLLLNKIDHSKVRGIIESIECFGEKICRINIPTITYSEFFIETERQQESMTILLKYYTN